MPAASGFDRGFVYVATGEDYRREAARSAARLRAFNPGVRICLVTDREEGPAFWDDLRLLESPTFGLRDKLAMPTCPYERFVFIDTDTLVLGSLAEVFQLLDGFDAAGHQLFEGHDYFIPGVPDAFPEFQSGVLGFRRSAEISGFFERWRALYDRYLALNRDGAYDIANVSDQKSLRMALYESKLRLAVLGPEYNFRPVHVNFACAAVRVLHGRGRLEPLAGRINRELGNRAYLPRLDAVVSDGVSGRELRRLWSMATLQILRAAGTALIPLWLRDRLRDLPLVRRFFLRNDFSEKHPDHDATWQLPPPSEDAS